jgi:hypothetical protein
MSHFYTKDGQSAYEVPCKSRPGEMRATTLADAKKLGLVPSVTTIFQLLDKPALNHWLTEQVFIAIDKLTPRKLDESLEIYKSRIITESKKISESTSKRGTEIHDKLEHYIKGLRSAYDLSEEADYKIINAVSLELEKLNPSWKWVTEQSFYHPAGFGGKVDLHSQHDPFDPEGGIILDFKTKNTADFTKKLAYPEHMMQLAAYRLGLDKPKAVCYDLFISTVEPGLVKLHKWTEEEIQKGEKMFLLLLEYWKLANNI